MGKSRRLPAAVAKILLVAGLAVIWMALAPVKLGGQVSFVMVNGNSMEPGIHKGDLALVRQSGVYQVGDIVTYHDGQMNADVIHRIIGVEGDQYVLQGDNNSWIDAYHPTQDEIVGKLWIHLPQLATAIGWVRTPLNMALTAGLLGGIFMLNTTPKKSKKNRKQKHPAAGNFGGMFETALYAFGILALAFLALSIFAFTRPLTLVANKLKYEQIGVFSYSATGAPGVYDGDLARSGEPVFTKLTCALDLSFAYALAGTKLDNIFGSQQMYALLSDEGSGWQKTLPLNPVTTFSGGAYVTRATLDMCQVQALVAGFEKQTGFRPSANTLAIVAQISIAGKLSGLELRDSFAPRLVFKFDSSHFYLAKSGSGTDVLTVIQPGTLANPALVENSISLPGIALPVQNFRGIAVAGLGLSLAGLLAVGLKFTSAVRRSQAYAIQLKFGGMLVNVMDRNLGAISPMVDVASIEDLARIAERQSLNILHLEPLANHPIHSYYLQNNGMTYRFVTSDTRQRETVEPEDHNPIARAKKLIVFLQMGAQTTLTKTYRRVGILWKNFLTALAFPKIFTKLAAFSPAHISQKTPETPPIQE